LLHGAKTSFETRQEGLREEGSSQTSAARTHTHGTLTIRRRSAELNIYILYFLASFEKVLLHDIHFITGMVVYWLVLLFCCSVASESCKVNNW
jgi:hypothetical protein